MKKKLFIALLTLICALTCAFSFVACGEDKDDGKGSDTEQGGNEQGGGKDDGNKDDDNGGTSNTKDKAEVTAAEWVAIIGGTDNYTAVSTQNGVNNTVKVDKDNFEINASGQKMIYAKDGGNYYVYTHMSSQWIRMSIQESMYKPMADSMTESMAVFKDKMDKFTYADGVYTAATLQFESEGESVTLKNVKIKFNEGKLISIDYDMEMSDSEVHGSLSSIGTTKIEVPTQFTEMDMPEM